MPKHILFVCLGNICRSPLAQGIAQSRAAELGLPLIFDSAGTGAWHAGEQPDPRAIVAARTRGYEISEQRARRVSPHDFADFDMIIAMDQNNLSDLQEMKPPNSKAQLHLMTEFLEGRSARDIADPYYSGRFMPVIDQLETATAGLLAQFREPAQ